MPAVVASGTSPVLTAPLVPPATLPVAAVLPVGARPVDTLGPSPASSLVSPPRPGHADLPSVGRPARRSPIAVRVDRALDETRASLVARHSAYGELIVRHQQTIQALEAELAAVNRRIASKTNDIRALVDRKRALTAEISQNRRIAAAAAAYGGLMSIFTLGASDRKSVV